MAKSWITGPVAMPPDYNPGQDPDAALFRGIDPRIDCDDPTVARNVLYFDGRQPDPSVCVDDDPMGPD